MSDLSAAVSHLQSQCITFMILIARGPENRPTHMLVSSPESRQPPARPNGSPACRITRARRTDSQIHPLSPCADHTLFAWPKIALPFYTAVGLTKGALCLTRKCPVSG